MTHRQAAEDEAAVVGERLVLQHVPQLKEAAVKLRPLLLAESH